MAVEFRGNNLEALYSRDDEMIVSGPAGTGKSVTLLTKMMLAALKYPESRHLIARKTRESLTESGLVTWETKVLPKKLHEQIAASMQRRQRSSYIFPNKSEVVVGGLDKPTKIMSTEYDTIYVQEALELTLNDWESLNSRLRNNRMPYQQLNGDTNPDAPYHWILQRAKSGALRLIESRHEDNPSLFDASGQITEFGRKYIGRLDRLTGTRYQRLRKGLWVQAEGTVYDNFDQAVHMVSRFEIPSTWARYWSVDFGYTNPFVWQAWAEDTDGRLYLYRQIYMSQRTVKQHARQIMELTAGEPLPQAIICDHDAEDRETLRQETGLDNYAAYKAVSTGIQGVKERLERAGDGKPRIYIMRNSLVEYDPRLEEKKIPTSTEEEF